MGRVMGRAKHYKRLPLAGLTMSIVALTVLAWRPAELPLLAVLSLLLVIGLGIGTVFPVTTVGVQNVVAPHQLGTATGLLNLCRALSSAIIVAVFGAIALSGIGVAVGHEGAVGASPAAIAGVAWVFRWVFAAGAMFIGLSLFALAMMEERPLRTAVMPAAPEAPVPVAVAAE
jgi:MFS family permease